MTKEAIYKRYANQKPVGVAYIKWGFHKHMVHYSTAGRAFIRKGSLRIYLDEVMRIA